jgi:hypothetical protein
VLSYEQLSDAEIEALLYARAAAQRCDLLVEQGADHWIAAFVKHGRFGSSRMTLLAYGDKPRSALVLLLRQSDVAAHVGAYADTVVIRAVANHASRGRAYEAPAPMLEPMLLDPEQPLCQHGVALGALDAYLAELRGHVRAAACPACWPEFAAIAEPPTGSCRRNGARP